MKGLTLLVVYTAVLLVCTGCSTTQHSYRFFTENDSYHPVERPDANYTSGILFMASPAKKYGKGDNKSIDRLNPFQKDPYSYYPITIEYGLGQTFYTPDDIAVDSLDDIDRNDRLLSEDRPYAGLLFLQGAIHNHYSNGYDRQQDMRRSVFGKIGLTGDGSFSEEMHTGVHKSRNLIVPVGWGMQVGPELVFSIGAEQRNRLMSWGEEGGFGADVVSNLKGSLGSIYTAAEGGLTLRAGFNLPRRVQENSITEQIEVFDPDIPVEKGNTDNPAPRPTWSEKFSANSWHFYVFVGHQTRLVLRDFAIDGRLFNDDIHTVQREPVVNEFQYGGQLRIATNWVIQALFAHRDKQFKSQRKEHSFGQYMIMYQRPFEIY
ncbi:MAG: lipid A deacylase LpxR family protein [Pseudomonadota bacterium]